VLVQTARAIALWILLSSNAAAQTPAVKPAAPAPAPFEITDNSFLVEEAFNQEAGIFQNIFGAIRTGGMWAAGFTQEWPAPSQTHQLSYTAVWLDSGTHVGFGDVMINYRWQATVEGPGRPAFSPRVSLILPTGSAERGLGEGTTGLQFNLPFSRQTGDWYWHWNAGLTWFPGAKGVFDDVSVREGTVSPFLAGSAIRRLRPMFNLLESVVNFDESLTPLGGQRSTAFTLSPGMRGGWNIGEHQLILGLAAPITWSDDERDTGAFLYLSYELPFKKVK
jgi:hypothetical protein